MNIKKKVILQIAKKNPTEISFPFHSVFFYYFHFCLSVFLLLCCLAITTIFRNAFSEKSVSRRFISLLYIFFVLLIMRSYHETLLGKHCVLLRITIIQPTSTTNKQTQIHTQLHFNNEVYLCHHLLFNIIV